MGQLVEMCLGCRELAGEREKSSVHMVKTIIVFCHFLYSNLVEELPEEVP